MNVSCWSCTIGYVWQDGGAEDSSTLNHYDCNNSVRLFAFYNALMLVEIDKKRFFDLLLHIK